MAGSTGTPKARVVKTLSSSPADLSYSFPTLLLLSRSFSHSAPCLCCWAAGQLDTSDARGAYAGQPAICRHSGSGEFHIDPKEKKMIIIITSILKSGFCALYGFGSPQHIHILFFPIQFRPLLSLSPSLSDPHSFTPFFGRVLYVLSFLNCLASVCISPYH